ncbi:MAG TPA: 2-oxo-4-hydroxy-4-carboxy-5-ureidoimidazoline decarboxylase [Nocardioidaceae bacterium]|nr:2-oxo-4-hydroxy-4-carboxy-5-ureidoimidazoline decarboxylase [Nocardioidaceae bacterium]
MTHEPTLSWFNGLSDAEAVRALRGCCASVHWAERIASGRPYERADDLYAAADATLATLAEADIDEALAAHPRIGDRPTGADSRREQAGVAGASEQTLADLAAANRAYEARFGHVYLVCATGKSADELLDIARSRLSNDPATERRVLRAELAKINHIRLTRLLGGSS